jgi:ribosomal protein S18 acetylase RimI-like enzyme
MDDNSVRLVEIVSLNDDLLCPWFDLYETTFPFNERLLISTQLNILKGKTSGEVQDRYMYAALDENGKLVGLVEYEYLHEANTAFLWYLAVQPNLRNKGIGGQIYQCLIEDLASKDIQALVFEVEKLEQTQTEEHRKLAERRISFYRRHGAKILEGVDYIQYIGWHAPPTPMHLMVHPLKSLNSDEAYALAKIVFEDSLQQTGDLTLS